MEVVIIEIMNNKVMKRWHGEANMSLWDEKMRSHWTSINIPPYIGPRAKKGKYNREICAWQPPMSGWFKLNFDGASRGNPGQAGIRCYLHKSKGIEVAQREKLVGIETNNKEELTALVEGLEMCKESGVEKLAIEGDSAIVINALRKGSIPNWRFDVLLSRDLNLGRSFKNIIFNHIFREGNSRADELVNMGANGFTIE
ncbi:uncharacterized protein LOC131874293 [Cryptomeria japonica]|uniref:uncharacterized protein LOC131874293 n=1 Tax=Cryptomeria japonica TaxID=3369 RepID=UPI0027DAB415|nr:uncharacterized protein LOC131874293 [Cryptomeria japonica]